MGLLSNKGNNTNVNTITNKIENYTVHFGEVLVFEFTTNSKFIVTLDDKFITIEAKGTLTALNRGFTGMKTIKISSINAIQLKDCGGTTGYLQLAYSGASETKGGVKDAVEDENTILFRDKDFEKAIELRTEIMKRM